MNIEGKSSSEGHKKIKLSLKNISRKSFKTAFECFVKNKNKGLLCRSIYLEQLGDF